MIHFYYPIKEALSLRLHFILLALVFFSSPSWAQVTQEWERRYDSAIPTFESGALSAVDAAGHTYVAGNSRTSTQSSPTNYDGYVIARFSPTGEVLWKHRFPFFQYPHAVADVALDETGFYVVYSTVGVGSKTTMSVMKYALEDGETVWRQSEMWISNMIGIELLTDNRGGVILVGSGHYNMPGDFTQLFKYDAATGKRQWRQVVSGSVAPNVYQNLAGIALDSQGDIYLTGSTGIVENDSQMLTTKRSGADGSLVWQMQYDTNLQDRAMQLAVDEAGGVYAWGVHYTDDPSQPTGSTLLKYDAATGRQVWIRRVEGTAIPEQLVADETGGLYLRSSSEGQNQLARHSATTGYVSWSTTFAGTGTDMVADEAGNLYLGNRQNNSAYTVRRYSVRGGDVAWAYNSPADSTYLLQGLTLSKAGTLHVSGTSSDAGTHLFATSLQTATGALVYNLTFMHTFSGVDLPANMVTDDAGNVYATASVEGDNPSSRIRYLVLLKFSAAGELLWKRQLENSWTSETKHLAIDATGSVYVMVHAARGNAHPDIVLHKVNGGTGDVIWESVQGPTEANVGKEIKLGPQGNLYLMGTTNFQASISPEDFLLKINPETGENIWTKRYGRNDPESELNELVAFAFDEVGEVYVTGTTRAPAVVNNLVLTKYASGDGSVLWQQLYNSGNPRTLHRVSGLAVDNTGGVYLAAFDDLETDERVSYLLKFDASNGNFVWRQPMTDQGTTPGRLDNLLVDHADGAYVTGFINGRNHIIKFSTEAPGVVWASPLDGVLSEIELDTQGGIYATSWSIDGIQQHSRTVKIRTSDGARAWEEIKEVYSGNGLLAVDKDRNVFIAGIVYDPNTRQDALLVKYSQDAPCAPVVQQAIAGPDKLRVGSENVTYTLEATKATSYTWTVEGPGVVRLTGQGTAQITTDWPTAAGFYEVNAGYGNDCSTHSATHKVAVYNPDDRIVAAAGWLHSPQNTQLDYMQQEGRGYFGLAVQYRNRTEEVQGQVAFHLKENGLSFKSTSFEAERLIVFGQEANFKGKGTINGKSGYGFLVAIVNHALNVNNPNDRLRLMIWEEESGRIVYDNQAGDPEEASAVNRIGMGAMVLYDPKKPDLVAKAELKALGIELPGEAAVAQLKAYPNAFSDKTTISFALAAEEAYALEVYDMSGRLVQKVGEGIAEADKEYTFELQGQALSEGMYIARLQTDSGTQSVKLLLRR